VSMIVSKIRKGCEDRKECEEGWTKTQTQGTILPASSSVLEVVAVGSAQGMRGRRPSAARNTRWDWETAGRVLVEARVGGSFMHGRE
jgi:hypothetical protein